MASLGLWVSLPRMESTVGPYGAVVEKLLAEGVEMMAILSSLKDDHGCKRSYSSVHRFVVKVRPATAAASSVWDGGLWRSSHEHPANAGLPPNVSPSNRCTARASKVASRTGSTNVGLALEPAMRCIYLLLPRRYPGGVVRLVSASCNIIRPLSF